MFRLFLPTETDFFDFFEKHAALMVASAQELVSLITEGAIPSHHLRIQELEHEADRITYHCIEALHKTFITPFERNDIHRLISQMDDVIDYIEDTSAHLMIYKIQEMKPQAKELADVLVASTLAVEKAVKGLRRPNEVDALRPLFSQINQLENEGDKVVRAAVGTLFENEPDLRILIKWKEIFENIESAIDACDHVSHIIEGVLMESG